MARWTADEDAIMISEFPNRNTLSICEQLGRSYQSVASRASGVLKINKSEAFNKSPLAGKLQVGHNKYLATRYKKGQPSKNKGQKQHPNNTAACMRFRFVTGQVPHNFKPEGFERLSRDGYVEIKQDGRFHFKHRLIWEAANGIKPKGMVFYFIDRNKQNLKLDNIGIISSADWVIKNSVHRYGPDVATTFRLIKKLKRKINESKNI